ncbi:MAG TPA: hypothetical protein QGH28_06780, partial [Chloroflexota bacterium]|nr:hypothetical protein [Chloroflexota bacterium]
RPHRKKRLNLVRPDDDLIAPAPRRCIPAVCRSCAAPRGAPAGAAFGCFVDLIAYTVERVGLLLYEVHEIIPYDFRKRLLNS